MTTQPSTAFLPLLLRRSRAMLNRWIAGSSAATEELRQLEGRSMVIVVDKLERAVMLAAEQQQLRLREVGADATTDVLVRASLFDLLALLRADDPTRVSAGEIEFRGSLAVAERFTRMLRLARPTPEDELAGWVGDLPARVIARGGEAAFAWGRRTAGALERDVAEYLQAETRELPRPSELTEYFRDVERLRDDVDRMNQRVARLSSRLRSENS